jgi:hypothetical protein
LGWTKNNVDTVIKFTFSRRRRNNYHVKYAWISCCTATTGFCESGYIALQQQETPETLGIGGSHMEIPMSYTSSAIELAFTKTYAPAKAATKVAPTRGFFARLMDAMMAARMRQAEREIALYIDHTGGKFTDEAEREIERRFLSTSSRW